MTDVHVDLINEVVLEFVNDGMMFTAYEVSKEVQNRSLQRDMEFVRHLHMRDNVHEALECFVDGIRYLKKLHDVGADIPANLYYPVGSNPDQYMPLSRSSPKAKNIPSITVTTVQPSSTSPSIALLPAMTNITSMPGGRKADSRGTLCIPNSQVRELGFSARDTAYAYMTEAGTLVIARQPAPVDNTAYTVDDNLNIRVTASTLAAAGLETSIVATYDVVKQGSVIVVSNHK